eukprot:1156352-Pelagomonas_calceolata.AAC.4
MTAKTQRRAVKSSVNALSWPELRPVTCSEGVTHFEAIYIYTYINECLCQRPCRRRTACASCCSMFQQQDVAPRANLIDLLCSERFAHAHAYNGAFHLNP